MRRSTSTKRATIAVYAPDNHMRLTGCMKRRSIDKFNYGLAIAARRSAFPHSFVNSGYKGYLEDRRSEFPRRSLQESQTGFFRRLRPCPTK